MSTQAWDTYPFDDDPPPRGFGVVSRTGSLAAVEWDRSTAAVSARPPKALTEGQRRRLRRNVVIAAAARQGCSQRLLAEVFDLPRSRISEILAEFARS